MAERFHEIDIMGMKRQLPILNLPDKSKAIAAFVILGDVALTEHCAKELAKRVPKEAELVMTAETKGIPLAGALARHLGMDWYIVARKSIKAYMRNPLGVVDESITTPGRQRLYITDEDIPRIKGRRILLVDDVISRGGSMLAMRNLAERAGGRVIAQAAAIAEGDAAKRDDIIYLASMPVFDPQ